MKNLLMFFVNFIMALFFLIDIMAFYTTKNETFIRAEVNREIIMWFGFLTAFISAFYFLQKKLY